MMDWSALGTGVGRAVCPGSGNAASGRSVDHDRLNHSDEVRPPAIATVPARNAASPVTVTIG